MLVHLPLVDGPGGDRPSVAARERDALTAATAVVTTSEWTRTRLVGRYELAGNRVRVVLPGVDRADAASGTEDGGELLCVAAVAPHKGHDVLVTALSAIRDLNWRCRCVGSLQLDPDFAAGVQAAAADAGLHGRLIMEGTLHPDDLDPVYRASDLLVHPSRGETYGMVIAESLARGLPVFTTDTGGTREALGSDPDGRPPGILLRAGDAGALAAELRRWLTHPELRADLRERAAARRAGLPSWSHTVDEFDRVLTGVAA
jgi:glycosyltransferase involved in cell wall biosynthesis